MPADRNTSTFSGAAASSSGAAGNYAYPPPPLLTSTASASSLPYAGFTNGYAGAPGTSGLGAGTAITGPFAGGPAVGILPQPLPPRPKKPASRPLQRNQACITCRGRKVRCDAAKPGCGACRRSAAAHGEDPDLVICQYDEEEPPSDDVTAAPKPKKASAKIAALEEKIAELEKLIRDHQIVESSPSSQSDAEGHSGTANNSKPSPVIADERASLTPGPFRPDDGPVSLLVSRGSNASASANPSSSSATSASGPAPPLAAAADPMMEIFWPGWPAELPHPTIVSHVSNMYLNRFNTPGRAMLDPGYFRHCLTLPPTHPGFPHAGVIHAMMAVSYMAWGGDNLAIELNGGRRYWPDRRTVAEHHHDCAKRAVEDSLAKGQNLFQMSQAINLICLFSYASARFVEVWIYCGFAIRIATPLGLNHLETCHHYRTGAKQRPRSLLPPPATQEEKYHRAVTFWCAFQADRFASASSGWAHSIDEKDVSTLLPSRPGTSLASMEDVDYERNPLALNNPSFFSSHPPDADEYQLELKATVLLGRVTTWLQRAPAPVGSNLTKKSRPKDIPTPDLRSTPDFLKLDQDLSALRLSTPRRMLDILKGQQLDPSRLLVAIVPHVAAILLHEPFCTRQPDDSALERCLTAARAVLNYTYQLFSYSFDFRLIHPFTSFCWAVAGRALVRDLALQELRGNVQGFASVKSELDTILLAMDQFGHFAALGASVAVGLRAAVQHRDVLLPAEHLAEVDLGFLSPQPGLETNTDPSFGGRQLPTHPPVPPIPSLYTAAAAATANHVPVLADAAPEPSSPIDFGGAAWSSLLEGHATGLEVFRDLGNGAVHFPGEVPLQGLDAAYFDQMLGGAGAPALSMSISAAALQIPRTGYTPPAVASLPGQPDGS